jgi:hypothetical protein
MAYRAIPADLNLLERFQKALLPVRLKSKISLTGILLYISLL